MSIALGRPPGESVDPPPRSRRPSGSCEAGVSLFDPLRALCVRAHTRARVGCGRVGTSSLRLASRAQRRERPAAARSLEDGRERIAPRSARTGRPAGTACQGISSGHDRAGWSAGSWFGWPHSWPLGVLFLACGAGGSGPGRVLGCSDGRERDGRRSPPSAVIWASCPDPRGWRTLDGLDDTECTAGVVDRFHPGTVGSARRAAPAARCPPWFVSSGGAERRPSDG
jgi:hypothetical protein